MSIQQSIHATIIYKILIRLKFIRLYDICLLLFQFLFRKIITTFNLSYKDNQKIFFNYYNHYTHPDILKRYYGRRAPLYWSTLQSSKVVHCIQHSTSEFLGKKVIIEPNDNCLVIGASLGIYKPNELVSRCNDISDYISSSAVSRVLVGHNDLINHARYYFSDAALKKFFIYPESACMPAVTDSFLNKKKNRLLLDNKIKFLSIASDFRYKAVELLLEAFVESHSLSELTLVCHNIPDDLRKKILTVKNIHLIEDLPLSNKKKDLLYKYSDVYVNTTYVDGGGTVFKALEYGLPIITFTYHRGKGFVQNGNGILLSEPMKYYNPESYGIHWNSIEGYLEKVYLLKAKGGYDDVKQQLINAFKHYEQEPLNVFDEGIKSLELAKRDNLERSNQILRDLYKEVAEE